MQIPAIISSAITPNVPEAIGKYPLPKKVDTILEILYIFFKFLLIIYFLIKDSIILNEQETILFKLPIYFNSFT